MKTLYLMRHAKSSWKDSTIDDFDRPLNKRGLNDAPLVGKYLYNQKIAFDEIISSPARRAANTAELIANEIKFDHKIIFESSIYNANSSDLLKVIRSIKEDVHQFILIGHNPSLNELANYLLKEEIDNIPTAGVVAISFDVDWKEIIEKSGKLVFFIYPKILKAYLNKKAD